MQVLAHLSGFKRVLELMKAGKTAEATALQKSLQDEFMVQFDENETLKRQLSEVAAVLDLSECMSFDGQKYWLEEDGKREGPYCQVCYDRDATLVRLAEHDRHYECRSCHNLYMKPKLKTVTRKEITLPKTPLKEPIPIFAK